MGNYPVKEGALTDTRLMEAADQMDKVCVDAIKKMIGQICDNL